MPLLDYRLDYDTGALIYVGEKESFSKINFVANPLDSNAAMQKDFRGYGEIEVGYGKTSDGSYWTGWIDFNNKDDGFEWSDSVLSVTKRFVFGDNSLVMEVRLENSSDREIIIDQLALAVPVNNDYTELRYDQRYLYDSRVYEHIYSGGTCGYQLVERLSGEGPVMYAVPLDGAEFQHVAHFRDTVSHANRPVSNHSWPGYSKIFLLAEGYIKKNNYKPFFDEGSVSSVKLDPGASVTYRVEIGILGSLEDFEKLLLERRKMHITPIPGMVVSKDSPVMLYIVSDSDINVLSDDGVKILGKRYVSKQKSYLLELQLTSLGPNTLKVINESGASAYVQFFVTDSFDELIKKRSKFILNNQVYKDEEHALNGGILPYSDRSLVYGSIQAVQPGIFAKEDSIWGNGSYEGGITDALFVAEKNVLFPDKDEIDALEEYVDSFLRRYLQDPETSEVMWWCGGFNTLRSYNYMHVANFYLSMHLISARYGLTTRHNAQEYLRFAFDTLLKMYEISRDMDLVTGMMGGWRVFEILECMKRENMVLEYFTLLLKIKEHCRLLFLGDVPYGSECAYDNTGYEMVVYFADWYGEDKVLNELRDVIRSVKGKQPIWWWYGGDIRWWDAEVDFSENCLHYTTSLNSGALLHILAHRSPILDLRELSLAYGGIAAPLSKVREDGFASMTYCWEQESPLYGFHPFTGDVGLGLFGTLVSLSCFAAETEDFGLLGYLCDVDRLDESVVIVPRDGLRKKVFWRLLGVEGSMSEGIIRLESGQLEKLEIDTKSNVMRMWISYDSLPSHKSRVNIDSDLPLWSKARVNGVPTRLERLGDKRFAVAFDTGADQNRIVLEVLV